MTTHTTRNAVATAYSYIRFSTPEQMKGDSLRRQLEATRQYCQTNHLHLDESLRDLGVSAFKGRNRTKGALAKFLQLVQDGSIAEGSVLIVESLDRLSRQEVLTALNLFTGILEAGVQIVTLMDQKTYTADSVNANPMDLMYSIMIMGRANDESATKSKRVGAAWNAKRAAAVAARKPLTARCPGWMELDGDSYRIIPQRAAVVRQMIAWAKQGIGCIGIAQRMNAQGLNISTRGYTHTDVSSVIHVLRSRALIGEYTPKSKGQKLESIANYYPALLTEPEFYALQSVLDARSKAAKGRRGKSVANLFGRLLVSGIDDSPMILEQKRSCASRNLIAASSRHGTGDKNAFSYAKFEHAFLHWVSEVKVAANQPADRTAEIQGRIAEAQERIAAVNRQLDTATGQTFETLLAVLTRQQEQLGQLQQELEQERRNTHAVAGNTNAIRTLAEQMEATKDAAKQEELRESIRLAIAGVVKQIKLYASGTNLKRLGVARVLFHDDTERLMIMVYRRGDTYAGTYTDVAQTNDIDALIKQYQQSDR